MWCMELVMCCLIFVGDEAGEVCWIWFVQLVVVVFTFVWSGVLEGDGGDCTILVT